MKKTIILLLFTVIILSACNGAPKGELVLSDPINLEGFSEENAKLIGSIDGEELVFIQQGNKEIFTYIPEDEERKALDKFTDSYFVDPNTGRLFYSKMSEDDPSKQKVVTAESVEDKKEKIGELEETFFITSGFDGTNGSYYEGMYVFVLDKGYGDPIKVDVLPVDGEYDKKLYESLKQSLENNTFDRVVSDGESLILASSTERKISDFSTGEEEILKDFNEVENFSRFTLNTVYEGNVLYSLFQYDAATDTPKASTHILNSEGEKDFSGVWGNTIAFVDENHVIAKLGDFETFWYLVSTETGIKRELDDDVIDFSISGDKVYYQLKSGEIRYIEFSYE